MRFRLDELSGSTLERAAQHFETHGYFIVEGAGDSLARLFKPLVAERMIVDVAELERILDPNNPPVVLPEEVRQRLSRITSTPELQEALLQKLEAIIRRVLGPFVHVSSTFHGQFKGGDARPVDHGGYDPNAKYLEVQGQYLIHQDFAGAALPTSPCGITLWTPLNSCPDWNLRLYPGSHRHGLLCQEWMKLEDPRLRHFGEPIDVKAEEGTAVIFNALLLHSSSNPGVRRRVSCDIRFFPLCGFLPSTVHVLGSAPLAEFRSGLAGNGAATATLREPYLEAAHFMGLKRDAEPCEPFSIFNWGNFVRNTVRGDQDAALADLTRFVNEERGIDGVAAYSAKFHNRPIHTAPLNGLLERLRAFDPVAPEVAALEQLVGGIGVAAS
ncbi:MAG: phytanoyl-CoA dioxygenase family protein [Gemmatimonadaceae bacterium]